MPVLSFRGNRPEIHQSCFIDASAQVIGDVVIEEASSVWFNSVIRGDVNKIRIGRKTNIQDLSVVHVLANRFPTIIGSEVTVGHRAVLHGCRVGNRNLIGMGAIVMDGAEIGDDCVVAAGALVSPGTKVPSGSLVVGSPAKVKRHLTDEERAWLLRSADNYAGYAREYLAIAHLGGQ